MNIVFTELCLTQMIFALKNVFPKYSVWKQQLIITITLKLLVQFVLTRLNKSFRSAESTNRS